MIRDAWALLTGALSDHEYRRSLEADRFGFFYEVPRRGWSHRAAKLGEALVQVGALLGAIVLWIAILVATTLQPVPR